MLIITACSLFFAIQVVAQGFLEDLNNKLGRGEAPGIARYLDNSIRLSLNGSEMIYSKAQAEMILKDFFQKNPPSGFLLEHSGQSGTNEYIIGKLQTQGKPLRVYYVIKQQKQKTVLLELRIEK